MMRSARSLTRSRKPRSEVMTQTGGSIIDKAGDLVVSGLRAFPDDPNVMSFLLAPGLAELLELVTGHVGPERAAHVLGVD